MFKNRGKNLEKKILTHSLAVEAESTRNVARPRAGPQRRSYVKKRKSEAKLQVQRTYNNEARGEHQASLLALKVVELLNQNVEKKEQKLKTDKQYKRRQRRQENKLKKL